MFLKLIHHNERKNFNYNIYICLIFFFFCVNNIQSKIIRPDQDLVVVGENIIKFINTNFKNNTYTRSFQEYSISMKFSFLKLQIDQKINPYYYKDNSFFTLDFPLIEFILSMNITNNNDFQNNPDDKVSIIFNPSTIEPYLKFELQNIYSKIEPKYIEFIRRHDNTIMYSFYNKDIIKDYRKNVDVFIDIKKIKSFPKIDNFLNEHLKEIEDFLFDSFCLYLNGILAKYPEPDGVFIYKELVKSLLLVNTYSLNITEDLSLNKVIVNEFKEENYTIDESCIRFMNIYVDLVLFYDDGLRKEYLQETIPEIDFTYNFFSFSDIDFKVGNTTLNEIIGYLFDKIMENYIYEKR